MRAKRFLKSAKQHNTNIGCSAVCAITVAGLVRVCICVGGGGVSRAAEIENVCRGLASVYPSFG